MSVLHLQNWRRNGPGHELAMLRYVLPMRCLLDSGRKVKKEAQIGPSFLRLCWFDTRFFFGMICRPTSKARVNRPHPICGAGFVRKPRNLTRLQHLRVNKNIIKMTAPSSQKVSIQHWIQNRPFSLWISIKFGYAISQS